MQMTDLQGGPPLGFFDPRPTRVPILGTDNSQLMIGPGPWPTSSVRAQADFLRDIGVTDVLDTREEWSEAGLWRKVDQEINYVRIPLDDNGVTWSETTISLLKRDLKYEFIDSWPGGWSNRLIYVHCHMGVNRGPSVAMYLMEFFAEQRSVQDDHLWTQLISNMLMMLTGRVDAAGIYYQPNAQMKAQDNIVVLDALMEMRSHSLKSVIRRKRSEGF